MPRRAGLFDLEMHIVAAPEHRFVIGATLRGSDSAQKLGFRFAQAVLASEQGIFARAIGQAHDPTDAVILTDLTREALVIALIDDVGDATRRSAHSQERQDADDAGAHLAIASRTQKTARKMTFHLHALLPSKAQRIYRVFITKIYTEMKQFA